MLTSGKISVENKGANHVTDTGREAMYLIDILTRDTKLYMNIVGSKSTWWILFQKALDDGIGQMDCEGWYFLDTTLLKHLHVGRIQRFVICYTH
jgi:hypothetical protein